RNPGGHLAWHGDVVAVIDRLHAQLRESRLRLRVRAAFDNDSAADDLAAMHLNCNAGYVGVRDLEWRGVAIEFAVIVEPREGVILAGNDAVELELASGVRRCAECV